MPERRRRRFQKPRRGIVHAACVSAVAASCFWVGLSADAVENRTPAKIGASAGVGCRPDAKRVKQLVIEAPGVYENFLVDGEWGDSALVKILADDVTLRDCEIRHGTHNAIVVYARNVVIESCKIHHVLAGTFAEQDDAHGITGCPTGLIVRDCDIGLVSGDCLQFDPGRGVWGDVLVENCTLWTGPLVVDAGGFKKGERPGENAIDTKQRRANPRSRMTIRNCLLFGWKQPGQVSNLAALNLKNHVEVDVQNCVFRENEICLRVRGGEGEYGGASVTIENCALYDSAVGIRIEDKIENLKVRQLGIGAGVERKRDDAGGGPGTGFEFAGEYVPPPIERVLESGPAGVN